MAGRKTTKPKKATKPKRKSRYVLLVSYPLAHHAWGAPDRRLEAAAKRACDGSGTYFGKPACRDMNWYYCQRPAAEAALRRVKALRLKGIDIELKSDDE